MTSIYKIDSLIRPILLWIYLFISFTFLSCNKENAFDCVKSTGNIETIAINTEDFHSISLSDDINLTISQGPEKKVLLTSGKNLVPKIKFRVENKVLYISNQNTCNWVRKYGQNSVHITIDDLNTLYHNGYGQIHSEGTLNFGEFNIENIEGNGDISLNLEVHDLNVISRSYAAIKLTGTAHNLDIYYIFNHGKFLGENLMAEHVNVRHSGLNLINIYPIKSLNIQLLHTGNVAYYNEPELLDTQLSSTGQVIKMF